MLEGIQFDFDFIHIEELLAILLKKYFINEVLFKKLAKTSWTFVLYYYCTDLCLRYPPQISVLVIVALSLQKISKRHEKMPLSEIFQIMSSSFPEEIVQKAVVHFPRSHLLLFPICLISPSRNY